jgi:hypothetical protein
MSITTRLWTDEDLSKIGKDKWLTTIFMNAKTFSEKEIKHYPYQNRKEYIAYLDSTNDCDNEDITFYATDDKNAMRFIESEYNKVAIESVMRLERKYTTIYNRE